MEVIPYAGAGALSTVSSAIPWGQVARYVGLEAVAAAGRYTRNTIIPGSQRYLEKHLPKLNLKASDFYEGNSSNAGMVRYGKRKASSPIVVMPAKRAYKPSIGAMVVRGSTRTGGFYGRYNQSRGSRGERKFFDTALSFGVDLTGEVPATGQLNLIPQGVTESTRVGRKCTIKSIQIRGICYSSATVPEDIAYIYLVQDSQANGAAAAVTDVLTNSTMSTAMINLANSQRFRILKRFIIHPKASAGVAAAYETSVVKVDFYKKCNIPLEFSSTTGALTELKSNNLFLLAGSASVDDGLAFAGTCRLRFDD